MADYYRAQDAAYRLILDLRDLQPLARHDVLDFSDTPRQTMAIKAAELRAAAEQLDGLRKGIEDSAGWMSLELQQAELSWHVAAHLAHRITAWEAALAGDSAAAELVLANGHLEWLEAWETESNAPLPTPTSAAACCGRCASTRETSRRADQPRRQVKGREASFAAFLRRSSQRKWSGHPARWPPREHRSPLDRKVQRKFGRFSVDFQLQIEAPFPLGHDGVY